MWSLIGSSGGNRPWTSGRRLIAIIWSNGELSNCARGRCLGVGAYWSIAAHAASARRHLQGGRFAIARLDHGPNGMGKGSGSNAVGRRTGTCIDITNITGSPPQRCRAITHDWAGRDSVATEFDANASGVPQQGTATTKILGLEGQLLTH